MLHFIFNLYLFIIISQLAFRTCHQKLAAFSIVDFVNICLMQDKASVKQFSQSKNYVCNENLFQRIFKMDVDNLKKEDIKELVRNLNKSAVIESSLNAIIRTMCLLDKIPLNLLGEVAFSIEEYKRAAILFEENARKKVMQIRSMAK